MLNVSLFLSFQHVQTQSFKNPFDIPREKLVEQLKKMRLNFYNGSSNKNKFADEGILLNYRDKK